MQFNDCVTVLKTMRSGNLKKLVLAHKRFVRNAFEYLTALTDTIMVIQVLLQIDQPVTRLS